MFCLLCAAVGVGVATDRMLPHAAAAAAATLAAVSVVFCCLIGVVDIVGVTIVDRFRLVFVVFGSKMATEMVLFLFYA